MNAWPAPAATSRYGDTLTAIMLREPTDWTRLYDVWAVRLAHLSVSDETGENARVGGDRSGREGLPLSASGTSVLPLSSPPELSLPERKKKGDAPTAPPYRHPATGHRTAGIAAAAAVVLVGGAFGIGACSAASARQTSTAPTTVPVTAPAPPSTTTSIPLTDQYPLTVGDAWWVTHNDAHPGPAPSPNEIPVPIAAAWDSVIHPVRPVPPAPPTPADITTGEPK